MVDVFLFYIQLSDELFSKIGSRRCTFFAMIQVILRFRILVDFFNLLIMWAFLYMTTVKNKLG